MVEIRSTHHGPLLTYLTDEMSKMLYISAPLMPDPVGNISMKWTGHEPTLNLTAWYEATKCTSVTCFIETSKYRDGTNANQVVASDEDIGYIYVGSAPIRVND